MKRPLLKLKHYYYLYFLPFFKYFTFKKFFNLFLNLFEYKTKKVYLESVPFVVYLDPVNLCSLECPFCPTGRKDKGQTKSAMSFEDFKKNLDLVKDYVFAIYLYKWGEPFLNKEIFKMIDYCHKNRVGVLMHSNLNHYDEEILQKIVLSKIDYLSVSIDGFSQKNYQFYRKKGNFEKALNGVKNIQGYKRRYRLSYPKLVWQFLINNQNYKDLQKAQNFAQKHRVEIFESRPLFLDMEVELKKSKRDFEKYLSKVSAWEDSKFEGVGRHCRYLWIGLTVNPNNSLAPCCAIYEDKDTFGFAREGPISQIINSNVFIESRKLFKIKNYKPSTYTPCLKCGWYTKD